MTDRTALERNKQTVVAFIDLAFNQRKPKEAVARYVGSSLTQHDPLMPDGLDAYVDFMSG